MSHEIDTSVYTKGAAYFAGEPAWHGLGTVTPDAKTSREAIKIAGLDWDVLKRELWCEGPDMIDSKGIGREKIHLPDHVATVRSDSNQVLGVVGKGYSVVQNREAFEVMDTG